MHALLLVVLSQSFAPPLEWFDGARTRKAWESPTLVATRSAEKVAPEAGAVLLVESAVMRVWQVKDAAALRAKNAALLPVLHDLPSTKARLRVPLGLVCEGQPREASWREALADRTKGCAPNFWYAAVKK